MSYEKAPMLLKALAVLRNIGVRSRIAIVARAMLVCTMLHLLISSSEAATTNWSVLTGDWSQSSNWDAGVPVTDSAVCINSGTATIASDGAVCYDLSLGYGSTSQTGNVNMTSGTLEVGHFFYIGKGTFSQSGGTTTTPNDVFWIGIGDGAVGTYNLSGTAKLFAASEYLANRGTGIINQTGGTNALSHNLNIGWGFGSGTYMQSGGITTVDQEIYIGCNEGCRGEYILKGDGQLSASGEHVGFSYQGTFTQSGGINTTISLDVGNSSNSTSESGQYFLSGGVLTTNYEIVGGTDMERYGTGIFTQTGGINLTTALSLTPGSAGKGTYNLNGGILATKAIIAGRGKALFNFGNGTLKANGTLSTDMSMTLTGTGGNANVDTTSGDITLSGVLSGPGGLNKSGTGTLSLAANNTYSGDTNVEGGTMSIGNPYLNDLASVSISLGATIDLSFAGSDTVRSLYLDGLPMALGTWGSSSSNAAHIDNVHFSGTGMLNVVSIPEPSTLALLVMGGIGLIAYGWRRRK